MIATLTALIHQCPSLDRAAPSLGWGSACAMGVLPSGYFIVKNGVGARRPRSLAPLSTGRSPPRGLCLTGQRSGSPRARARRSSPPAYLVGRSSTRCPGQLPANGSHYRLNIYLLAPGRDIVARSSTSLFAETPSPRGLNNRGRFFRRVERGRGHSGKKPGQALPRATSGTDFDKIVPTFNPPRFPSRPALAW